MKLPDVHTWNAALVYGKSYGTVSPDERRIVKCISILASTDQLSDYEHLSALSGVTEDNARELIRRFRESVLGVDSDDTSF